MGNQIITQPQTFKTNTVVIGSTAGLSAVSGLTVYGDISATGGVYSSTVGTVNSVGITSNGTITVSNSPVTTSGNISLSIASVPLSTVGNSLTFPSSGNITTYTLALSDNNNLLCITAGTSGVVAISPIIPYPVGYQTGVLQLSSGQITLSAGVGLTLSNEASATKTFRQFGAATLVNLGSRWVSYGSLA